MASSSLPAAIGDAVVRVADRLEHARVPYAIGGSVMMRFHGFDVDVGDVDLVAAGDAKTGMMEAMRGWVVHIHGDPTPPWQTEWFFTAECPGAAGIVEIDVIGGPALVVDGRTARLPSDASRYVEVKGRRVPLCDPADWYHVYRAVQPHKARLLARHLTAADLDAAAARLGIPAVEPEGGSTLLARE